MTPLPVPWWTFWLAAAVVLYAGLIWLFVREGTRFGRSDDEPGDHRTHPDHEERSTDTVSGSTTEAAAVRGEDEGERGDHRTRAGHD